MTTTTTEEAETTIGTIPDHLYRFLPADILERRLNEILRQRGQAREAFDARIAYLLDNPFETYAFDNARAALAHLHDVYSGTVYESQSLLGRLAEEPGGAA